MVINSLGFFNTFIIVQYSSKNDKCDIISTLIRIPVYERYQTYGKEKDVNCIQNIQILRSSLLWKNGSEGVENLPKNNTIIVANHCQMNGPIAGELFMTDSCYIWCAGEMMSLKEVPDYAFTDFWSHKSKWTQPFYKLLSYIIAPIAVCIFNNARTIAVYHDMRIMSTFRETIKMLQSDKNILIFPEKDEKHNNVLYKFQENFIDVAKLYYKKTGIELTFVPMYIAPKLRKMYIGNGICFESKNSIEQERKRISDYLSNEITDIARNLPLHTVIPYRNIPKKYYLTNRDVTEVPQK